MAHIHLARKHAMTTLVERLRAPEIGIDAASAQEFRAGLAALTLAMQGAEHEAMQRSLQGWWDWFEDEGYDRDAIATALRRLVTARIGESRYLELLGFSTSIASDAEGLPILISHLQETHPTLAEELSQLEAQALEDEHQLMEVAGGKAAKIAAYTVAGALVVGGTLGVIHNYRKYKELGMLHAELADKERQMEAKAAVDARLADEHAAQILAHEVKPEIKVVLPQLRSMDPEQRSAWFKASRQIRPEDAASTISRYAEKDIERHCNSLMWEHFITHEVNFVKAAFHKVTNGGELKGDISTALRDTEQYNQLFARYLKDHPKVNMIYNVRIPTEEERRAFEASDAFKSFKLSIDEATNIELQTMRSELYANYHLKMKTIVDKAKKEAGSMVDKEVKAYADEDLARKIPDDFGVDTKLHTLTKEAETKIARQVKNDIGVAEDDALLIEEDVEQDIRL